MLLKNGEDVNSGGQMTALGLQHIRVMSQLYESF